MKFFAAWLFLPLLLLKEKNVLRIIVNMVLCFIPAAAESLIFHKSGVLTASGNEWYAAGSGVVGLAQSGKIDFFGIGSVSLCVLLYLLLCIYCYMQKNEDTPVYIRKMIYASASAWMIFFLMYWFNCYWIVLMVPFVVLLVVTNSRDQFISTILELFFSVAFYINCQIRQGWVLGRFYKHGLLKEVFVKVFGFGNFETGTLGAMIDMNRLNATYSIEIFVNSIIVAVAIALLVIHFPGKRNQDSPTGMSVTSRDTSICLTVRNAISILVPVIPVLCYVYQMVMHNVSN